MAIKTYFETLNENGPDPCTVPREIKGTCTRASEERGYKVLWRPLRVRRIVLRNAHPKPLSLDLYRQTRLCFPVDRQSFDNPIPADWSIIRLQLWNAPGRIPGDNPPLARLRLCRRSLLYQMVRRYFCILGTTIFMNRSE